jgi:hypothetical protein
MAIFRVSKKDLVKFPGVETTLVPLCESVRYSEMFVSFIPKDGCLVAVGVLLAEKGISYELNFDANRF